MRTLATILLTVTVLVTFGQNHVPKDLGIGFAIATNPYKFEDGSHYENIYTDKDLKTKITKATIFPFFYKPDYGLYHFICLAKTADYYKVLVNDTTTAYLPNDNNFHFTTWETILLSATIERLTNDNPIRENANNNSKIIKYDCEPDRLKVEDIIEKENEYWIFVSFSLTCDQPLDEKTILNHGWVKWRTENKLLVKILLLC